MNILSLFDGISCGQLALERVGINVNKYYASEIDKYAIQITQKNYPNTIQLGDINKIDFSKFINKIDLLIGGSPCQGFSKSGKRLNFEDPRSRLFFKFIEAINIIKPNYYLFENVKMKKDWSDIITQYMNVTPIEINSSLVSAQNRIRLYWTNIPNIIQPKDKKILLKDIVLSNKEYIKCIAIRGRPNQEGKYIQKIELRDDNKTNTLTSASKDNFLLNFNTEDLLYILHNEKLFNKNNPNIINNKYQMTDLFKGISYNMLKGWECIRQLQPIEYERLQTLPDNYTKGISNTQRYKKIANGWTVDVISHILCHIRNENNSKQNKRILSIQ